MIILKIREIIKIRIILTMKKIVSVYELHKLGFSKDDLFLLEELRELLVDLIISSEDNFQIDRANELNLLNDVKNFLKNRFSNNSFSNNIFSNNSFNKVFDNKYSNLMSIVIIMDMIMMTNIQIFLIILTFLIKIII